MALIFLGKSTCPICHNILHQGEDVRGFPSLTGNIKDKLYIFSDKGCHQKCVDAHPFGKMAWDFADEAHKKFMEKKWWAGGNVITDYRNFYGLGMLTSDETEELFQYNFLTLDVNNIATWKDKEHFLNVAKKFIDERKWQDWNPDYNFWERVFCGY